MRTTKGQTPERELPLFDHDLYAMNRQAMAIVGHCRPEPEVVIEERRWLACVETDRPVPLIRLHPLFNVPWLPEEVLRAVLIHEHTHLLVPPREVKPGKTCKHPPEFWEFENRVSPMVQESWCWIHFEWWGYLIRDKKAEGVRVRKSWRNERKRRNDMWVQGHRDAGISPVPEQFITWQQAVEHFNASLIKDPLM